jgi:hypothetical protein
MLTLFKVDCMKLCLECLEKKPETEFYRQKNPTNPHYRRAKCKICCNKVHSEYVRVWKQEINARRSAQNREDNTQQSAWKLKQLYKISIQDYQMLFDAQNGLCKICGNPQMSQKRRLDVDHCHTTGRIRGLLCIRCNRGIGLLRDNTEVLASAIRYLQEE